MKLYNFILFPNTGKNTFENPYSSCDCTSVKDAELWAKGLLFFNKTGEYIVFRVVDGRKEYTYKREIIK